MVGCELLATFCFEGEGVRDQFWTGHNDRRNKPCPSGSRRGPPGPARCEGQSGQLLRDSMRGGGRRTHVLCCRDRSCATDEGRPPVNDGRRHCDAATRRRGRCEGPCEGTRWRGPGDPGDCHRCCPGMSSRASPADAFSCSPKPTPHQICRPSSNPPLRASISGTSQGSGG